MYIVKRWYHVELVTFDRGELLRWLRDHAAVSYWSYLLGRMPEGLCVEYI